MGGLIPVLGIMAAIAIPAFSKYVRRSKATEAKIELGTMFNKVAQHYAEFDSCPPGSGVAGPTPPLSVDCSLGEEGRCLPMSQPSGPAEYRGDTWTDDETWNALGFGFSDAHYFHYGFRWTQEDGGCQFTVQAFGDLDGDGVYSTYERYGTGDVSGINASAGLYIDQELE